LTCFATTTDAATPRTAFDGPWNLVFVTRSGDCDPTYDFTVNIANGMVTHPNLVRFTGRLAPSVSVRASVAVQDKYASGSAKLSRASAEAFEAAAAETRAAYWTAQRN
jgi:hypothetical protein